MILKIATQFASCPGGRKRSDGSCSAEEFYQDCLKPIFLKAIAANETLFVDLDGTAGYAASFLDEAFGRLALDLDFSVDVIKDRLKFISIEQPELIEEIQESIKEWHTEGAHENSALKKNK